MVYKGNKDGYRSAQVDVTVYDKAPKVRNHIEFKYGQIQSNAFPIEKDLLKLISEDGKTSYFVHYLVTEQDDKKTRDSLSEKFKKAIHNIDKKVSDNEIEIDDYNLRKGKVLVISQIIVQNSNKIYKNRFCLTDCDSNHYELT